jgi:uncharacterized protein YjbI with pentapeptide repeats
MSETTAMPTSWPFHITALPGVACGAVRWRSAGKHWASVFVKTTFELVNGGLANLVAPLAVASADRYRAPSGCLEEASDIAPYLPSAGVTLAGHAWAPGGRPTPTAAVRLAVLREKPLLDKTLHVFGDRGPGPASAQPFLKMPLVYERAYGGPSSAENPSGSAAPNLIDPLDARRPAGFGPISSRWPVRARLLGRLGPGLGLGLGLDPRALEAADLEVPEGIDWRWFHAAPIDQQIALLRGDEWIVLDGMHPTLPRVQTRLPSAVARARWHKRGAEAGQPVELCADTLILDADRLVASLVWRGRFELARGEDAQIVAGVELPGKPIAWPAAPPRSIPAPAAPAAPIARRDHLMSTVDAQQSPFAAAALPFAPPSSVRPSAVAAPDPLGSTVAAMSPFHRADPPAPKSTPRPAAGLDAGDPLMSTVTVNTSAFRHALPFGPQDPPRTSASHDGEDPPMATVEMRVAPSRSALPFAPSDPSRPPAVAIPAGGSRPVVRRANGTLTGTAVDHISPFARPVTPFDAPTPAPAPVAPAPIASAPVAPATLAPAIVAPAIVAPATVAPAMIVAEPPPPSSPAPPPPSMIAPPPLMVIGAALPPPAPAPAPIVAEPPAPISAPAPVSFALPDAPMSSRPAPSAPTPPAPPAPSAPVPPAPPVLTPPAAAVVDHPSAGPRDKVLERLLNKQPLHDLSLVDADLRDIDFQGASLSRLDLRRANLQGAGFRGVDAVEVQLESADLTGACFDGADLTRANLTRAVLSGARFDGAILVEANLQRVVGDGASFRDARLPGVDLRQARLQGAVFDGATLSRASAMKADLSSSRFVGADLEGSNLRDCKLREANLARANLEGADLRDADLTRANVHGASRQTAKLMPAQLKGLIEIETEPE